MATTLAVSCSNNTVSEGATGQLHIRFELASHCVAPGDSQSLTTRTSPGANVAYAVVYSDGRFHGETPKGDADKRGVFEGKWVVPADAPPGSVEVKILAVLAKKTGVTSVPFVVAPSRESCSEALASAAAASTTTTSRAAGAPVGGSSTSVPPPAPGSTTPSGPESTTTTSGTVPRGQFKSTITLGKSCLGPGGLQTFVVETAPNSPVTVVTRYSDNSSHGDNTGGISDSDGKFAGDFIVDPLAPKGEATVLATTSSRSKGVSFAQDTFTVDC